MQLIERISNQLFIVNFFIVPEQIWRSTESINSLTSVTKS